MSPLTTGAESLERFIPRVQTCASQANEQLSAVVAGSAAESERLSRWESNLDQRLLEWGRDPSQLEEDGFDTPTVQTIRRAWQLGIRLAGGGFPAPARLLATADGGVAFEWDCADGSISVEATHAGKLAVHAFARGRLVLATEQEMPEWN